MTTTTPTRKRLAKPRSAFFEMTKAAQEGFKADMGQCTAVQVCPHTTSSPRGMAWLVGTWMKANKLPQPQVACMSLGYRVCVDDMLFCVKNERAIERLE
jgi:hypothetical protein